MDEKLKCEICGSKKLATKTKNNQFNMILCVRHYKQMIRHGKILERTIYDKNEIIVKNDYAELKLYNKNGKQIGLTKIDIDDIKRVSKFKWSLWSKNGYVKCSMTRKFLHRFILDYNGDLEIDHINHDPLDNRKSNLRISTHADNSKNMSLPSNNKTGVIGVIWDKERNKWRAEIQHNNKREYIGRYNKKYDAIKQRLIYEKKYFGEYAPQKELFKKYGIE